MGIELIIKENHVYILVYIYILYIYIYIHIIYDIYLYIYIFLKKNYMQNNDEPKHPKGGDQENPKMSK
jgi:hypothetical protein